MAELLAFVGVVCIAAFIIVALPRPRAPHLARLIVLAIFLAGCGADAGGSDSSSRSDEALQQVRATLRSYVGTYATVEAASVVDYEPTQDMSNVVVRTRLTPGPESLAASQKICELARNVIIEVRVEANDGTELWSCDRVNSNGSDRLLAIARLQTTTTSPGPPTTEVGRRLQGSPKVVPKARTPLKPAATTIAKPAAGAGCHPSYSGECLPADASDVDCLGGTGDGPVYAQTKNIVVVGPDVFGLDFNHDGFGCDADPPAAQEDEPSASDSTEPSVTSATQPSVPTSTTQPPAPSETQPDAACHSSYSGECLPVNASDVDCAGGTGDGPVYAHTNNIRVVGPDVYDLDADGDGFGCDA